MVPGRSRDATTSIAVAAVSGRLIESSITGAVVAAPISRRLHPRLLRRDLRRTIGLSGRSCWLHVRSVELPWLDRGRYGRTPVILRCKQLAVLAGGLFMLNLRP